MKKIITLFLCAVFLCIAAVSVSAGAYDLGDYGQKTVKLTYPMTPFIDGHIEEEEYELSFKLVLDEDESDDNFFINGSYEKTEAEYVIVYVTADDDNIYFAVEQKDPLRVSFHDAMYLQISAGARTDGYIQIYLPYHRWPEILTESNRDLWKDYYAGYAASYTGDLTYYELAIPRSIIEKKFGVDELDKLLVTVAQRITASEDIGNVSVVWGFKSDELAPTHLAQGFPVYGYPNVLELYDKPDNEGEELPTLPEIVLPETEPESEPEEQTETVATEESVSESETEPLTEPASEGGCGATVSCTASVICAALALASATILGVRRKEK